MTEKIHLDKELATAVAAVRRAARVCQAVQRRLATAEALAKKDKSPVTVADFASQAVVCAVLAEAFPDDLVVGEEGTGELRLAEQAAMRRVVVEEVRAAGGPSLEEAAVLDWIDRGAAEIHAGHRGRLWTLDPIDGTKGFLRVEQYAVALALIENGEVVLGVLGCPNLPLREGAAEAGTLAYAIRGQGSRQAPLWSESTQGGPMRVSSVRETSGARFCESVESGHSDQNASATIAAALGITAQPVRMDSQAKYAVVGRGEASIYLRLPTRADYREKIWDHAAGMLVVEEAGGKVTDVDGKPLDFGQGRELARNRGVVATNKHVHERVLAAVGKALR